MGTVRVENHYYPPGFEFELHGMGLIKNFEDVEFDMVAIENFKALGHEWPADDYLVIVIAEPELNEVAVVDEQVLVDSRASLEHLQSILDNSENPRMSDAGGRISGDVETPNLNFNVQGPVAPLTEGTAVAPDLAPTNPLPPPPDQPAPPEGTDTTGGES